jgi:hypothetical protein
MSVLKIEARKRKEVLQKMWRKKGIYVEEVVGSKEWCSERFIERARTMGEVGGYQERGFWFVA